MSQWTEVRDNIVSALGVDDVTEQLKQQVTNQILTAVLPEVTAVADKFISQVQAQAKEESGWTKIRDAVVLPMAISGFLKIVTYALTKCSK